jgi:hypothetical protein
MLLDAIVKLHDKIQNMKLGAHREAEIEELEQAKLRRLPLAAAAGQRGQSSVAGRGNAPTLLGAASGRPDAERS